MRWLLGLLGLFGLLGLLASGAAGQGVRAGPVQTHTIGLDEDSLFFDRISGVVALPGGELVVAEMRASQVRRIDPDRLTSWLVGGAGGGPGEFRFPAEVGRSADRFWMYDLGLMRMTVFDGGGQVERTFRTPPLTGATSLLAGGVIAGTRRMPEDPERASRWLVLFDAEREAALDSIPLKHPWRRLQLRSGTLDIAGLQLWSDHTLWEPASDGSGVVVVDRPTSGPPEITVRWYDPAGGLDATLSLAYEPEPITRAHVQRVAEGISTTILDARDRFSSPIDRTEFSPSAIARQLHVPDRLPPVSAVTTGPDGKVYLRRGLPDNATEAEYWVLDRSGLLATATLPARFTPMSADRDGLWGVSKDALDREYLVRYRIDPPNGTPGPSTSNAPM